MTTPNKLNEFNHAEDPARRLLEKLGWTYVPAEQLAPDRVSEHEVLLKGRLRAALLRLNDSLTGAQAERVIFDLERADGIGMARNRLVHEYLTYGMSLTVDGPDGRDTRTVRFFDFDDPEGGLNEFVVTTQFRVLRGNEKGDLNDDQRVVIPDLVLFVNGIPLVVMEAKSPTLMDVWKTQAVRQLRRYQEAEPQWSGAGAPALFHYNLLCVAHCGAGAAFSSLYAPENAYSEWKSVLPYTEQEVRDRFGEEPKGQAQLIVGLLSPATLLDILRDYVVYELDSGKVIKKLPRYQQYRAVSAAMKRLTEGRRPEERGGVVWHTQGSGKSLTMLWLATKLRRRPALNNPTIVVVTDRKQLDDQISRTFKRCGFPAPEQADSGSDLRRLLTSSTGRTVMTTIQKFEEVLAAPEGELNTLNPADNIIVMVDEAHRTQYGLLGATLSKALPNAVLVGFTGTPIDKSFRLSTMRRFGPLIDSYTIRPVGRRRRDGRDQVRGSVARPGHPRSGYAGQALRHPLQRGDRRAEGADQETVRKPRCRRRSRAAHPDDRAGHRRPLQNQGQAQRIQGSGGCTQPAGGDEVRQAPERFPRSGLSNHHNHAQRWS